MNLDTYGNDNRPILLPGDVIFVRGRARISDWIRTLTRSRGEQPTWASHVGVMVDPDRIIEALSRVRIALIDNAYPDKSMIRIYRHTGLTDHQRWAISREAHIYRNRPYGYIKILAHALDWVIGGRYVFRRLAWIDRYPICSYVVAKAYDRAIDYRFGLPARAASPDDILDWVTEDDAWQQII